MKKYFISFFCVIIYSLSSAFTQVIHIDSKLYGRIFEGIGALSAGASSRLLIDYPEPQRSQILDYLFKPQFGASLHHLKVEIGGDVNSTCGTEPSHMHHRGEENYTRGYEWWLMKEAKTRNPSIMLDALAWGTPYWIGDGTYYSDENAEYMAKFIKGAKDIHGLSIDYIGCWNETLYNVDWLKTLRKTLNQYHLQTKIVAADEVAKWNIVNDMLHDSELFRTVDIIGNHYCQEYKGKSVWENRGNDYRIITPEALQCGKPIWSTEDGPWRSDWNGAKGIIKNLVRNYIEAKMTKTIIWSLVTSYYDILPLPNSGLMKANTPWSGHYELCPALWAMAHVGQFTQPGWTFLEGNANGYTQTGGSYISLMSPDSQDVSVIIETTEARSAQTIHLAIDPLWHSKTFHIWKTDSANWFIKEQTITVNNGYLTLTLSSNAIYTISTATGQQKGGNFNIPQKQSFPLPYYDDFESCPPDRLPKYTIDQSGVFETVTVGRNNILRQQIPQTGIEWVFRYNDEPYTVLGDTDMDDYSISIDVLLTKTGQCVDLLGRIGTHQWDVVRPRGYWLRIKTDGTFELCKTLDAVSRGQQWKKEDWPDIDRQLQGDTHNYVKLTLDRLSNMDLEKLKDVQGLEDKKNTEVVFLKNGKYSVYPKIVLASGKITFPLKKWNQVKLSFKGNQISAYCNGKNLCSVEDDSFQSGLTAFGCGWHIADFDNLKIEKTKPQSSKQVNIEKNLAPATNELDSQLLLNPDRGFRHEIVVDERQKAFNRQISSKRVKLAHAIGQCKIFRIVKDEVRAFKDDFRDTCMLLACGLNNFKIDFIKT